MTTIAPSGPVSLGSVRALFDASGNLDLSAGAIFRNGNVGIGLSSGLIDALHVGPGLSINSNVGSTNVRFNGRSTGRIFDFDCPEIGASDAAQVRLFRSTTTSGPKTLVLCRGDNTSTEDVRLRAGVGEVSYFANRLAVGKTSAVTGRDLDVSGSAIFSGNVGIGTTITSAKLDVNGNAAFHSIELNSPSGINGTTYVDFGYWGKDYAGRILYDNCGNYMQFAVTDSQSGFAPERMRIASNGNVGIGITNPQASLDVSGRIQSALVLGTSLNDRVDMGLFTSDVTGNIDQLLIRCRRKATTLGTIPPGGWVNSCFEILRRVDATVVSGIRFGGEGGSQSVSLLTGMNGAFLSNERLIVTETGNVGIGTTNPETLLHVNGNAAILTDLRVGWKFNDTSGVIMRSHVIGGEIVGVDRSFATAGLVLSSAPNLLRFTGYGTNGTVTTINSNGTISVTSDVRSKTAVQDISFDALAAVAELRPKMFKYLSDLSSVRLGFIAQEVETHLPWAVDGKKFEYEFVRDASGNVLLDEDGTPQLDMSKPRYRGFDTNAVVAAAVGAIKQLKEIVEAQQERIEALEARLAGSS